MQRYVDVFAVITWAGNPSGSSDDSDTLQTANRIRAVPSAALGEDPPTPPGVSNPNVLLVGYYRVAYWNGGPADKP